MVLLRERERERLALFIVVKVVGVSPVGKTTFIVHMIELLEAVKHTASYKVQCPFKRYASTSKKLVKSIGPRARQENIC